MPKTFTRTLRKLSSTRGRNRAPRPKTFSNEKAARKWAESNGITEYELKDLKANSEKTNKIKVIPK